MSISVYDSAAVQQWLKERREQPFRWTQISRGVYRDLITRWEELTTLPQPLREAAQAEIRLAELTVFKEQADPDGQAVKALLQTADHQFIESVLMRHRSGRRTVCVSSQVGCPMGCAFCATGELGFKRNLTTGEIVDQVQHWRQFLHPTGEEVRNVVFMGMGEPLANYEAVVQAIRILNDQRLVGIGARHLTISTCGLVPEIRRLRQEDWQVNLAVSLHAATDELRHTLMPIAYKYPLADLMAELEAYVAATNRRIFYEYILLAGVNDRPADIQALGNLLRGRLAHVNLIPYNATGGKWQTTAPTRIKEIQAQLLAFGVVSTVRVSLGEEIDAACGQLAAQS